MGDVIRVNSAARRGSGQGTSKKKQKNQITCSQLCITSLSNGGIILTVAVQKHWLKNTTISETTCAGAACDFMQRYFHGLLDITRQHAGFG